MRTARTWLHDGRQQTVREIAAYNPKLNLCTVSHRLHALGMTPEEALRPKMSRAQAGRRGKEASMRAELGRSA